MIESAFIAVLHKLYNELTGSCINRVVTGSLSIALQGLPLTPHDIDIQTDKPGAYEIERRFALSKAHLDHSPSSGVSRCHSCSRRL
jgi:hypothetical protein